MRRSRHQADKLCDRQGNPRVCNSAFARDAEASQADRRCPCPGLMVSIELVTDRVTKARRGAKRRSYRSALNGASVRRKPLCGPRNLIKVKPPLDIERAQLARALDVLDEVSVKSRRADENSTVKQSRNRSRARISTRQVSDDAIGGAWIHPELHRTMGPFTSSPAFSMVSINTGVVPIPILHE